MSRSRSLYAVAPLILALTSAAAADATPPDYTEQIRPILERHCFDCHRGAAAESDLRLDTAAGLLEGGNSGPALVAGKPDESLILRRVSAKDASQQMPPPDAGDALTAEEIDLLRAWIAAGAAVPTEVPATEIQADPRHQHWSFQPVRRPDLPSLSPPYEARVRTPVDRFWLARLERSGLMPSPDADRVTLLRRVSLDLTGLPPRLKETDDFLQDTSADAYEKAVDRLLASPAYGEAWARHWLDQARYADSDGYTNDTPRLIWRYRDWVIQALNRDMPFDQFTIEQLAGDLLPNPTTDQLIATGFHRNTQFNNEGGSDPEQYRVERVVDRVSTTGEVFLGLTLGCARCHDHKFDPVSQREFYQFYAFFNNCDEPALPVPTEAEQAAVDEAQQALAKAQAALAAVENSPAAEGATEQQPVAAAPVAAEPTSEENAARNPAETAATNAFSLQQRQELVAEVKRLGEELKKRQAALTTTLILRERAKPRETYIHLRGDFLARGRTVAPNVPSALPKLPRDVQQPTRLDLARWLVARDNPLTPRVAVNRLWQVYFGRGLVETDNDFGTQGAPPTHPELLDYLASEFVARGWSLKAMHRLIVTSTVYRQSSVARPELDEVDARNLLLARQSRHRLPAEMIRDAALHAAGLLSTKLGGPGVYPPQPDGVMRLARNPGRKWETSSGEDRYRRGLYIYYWRGTPYPFLRTFDAPDANNACTRRNRSNTPLQALTLLNDEVFFEAAQGLAARTLSEAPRDDASRLRFAFRATLSREPTSTEAAVLAELLAAERTSDDALAALQATPASDRFPADTTLGERAAWTVVARTLLNLDEFITRE